MALLDDIDIAELQAAWELALFDEGILQSRTEGNPGSYGYGNATYSNGATVACLFMPVLMGESTSQVQNIDGHVLLQRSVVVSNLMRIKITKLHGTALSPAQVYEIVDGPITHHVGQKVRVKLVTDGSAA